MDLIITAITTMWTAIWFSTLIFGIPMLLVGGLMTLVDYQTKGDNQ